VSQRSGLTHLGWPISLREFLDPTRTSSMPGHAFGFELSPAERDALVHELEQW
jgi:hypothetical protein